MFKYCTRREFIQAAAGAAAVGIIVSLPAIIKRSRQCVRCSKCGAVFLKGHKYREGSLSGLYCPNCGVELSRLCYNVDKITPDRYRRQASKSRKKKLSWEWAQVPFPNGGLIRETDKPTAVLSDFRF